MCIQTGPVTKFYLKDISSCPMKYSRFDYSLCLPFTEYSPYGGLNLANQKYRKLGVFNRKLGETTSLLIVI